jgi:hypothetical protein
MSKSEKGEMKVTKVQSGKATKYLCACVPMALCAFQIELDLELNLKTKPISRPKVGNTKSEYLNPKGI